MLACAHDFDGNEELIIEFFKIAPVEVRSQAIFFMGANILKEELKNIPSDSDNINIKKIQQIWDQRLSIKEPLKNKEELKKFGWWFVNSPYNKKWNIEQLLKTLEKTDGEIEPDHQVVKKLKDYVVEFPLLTIECLAIMVKNDKS